MFRWTRPPSYGLARSPQIISKKPSDSRTTETLKTCIADQDSGRVSSDVMDNMGLEPQVVPKRRLKDVQFGFASADYEASHDPDLLLRGFVDPLRLVDEAKTSRKSLFLGYKGSGKSALGEHLLLLSKSDPHLFVRFINIADISFSTFSQICKGVIEPEARYPMVWSWLLLLFLLDSFSKDQGSNYVHDQDLFLSIESLKQVGLLPQPELKGLVNITADKSFSFKLTTLIGSIETTLKAASAPVDFPFLVDRLKLVSTRFESESKHLLIIDGFDELLRRGHLQYDALGCLIFEANRLNMDFAAKGVPAKIILLCRTDLFERLPGPNKNKIRQNAAVHIDWYRPPEYPRQSQLVNLINRRASLAFREPTDVFTTYLPSTLRSDGTGDIRAQILDNTRHLPRDIIMLFRNLQNYSGDRVMTPSQISSGLAQYSRDYFIPEIQDELDGYISGEQISFFMRLVGSIRRISVSLNDLDAQAKKLGNPQDFDLIGILRVLFECSAIGNVELGSTRSAIITTFKFRNRHASLNESRPIILHRGLWSGLGLRW